MASDREDGIDPSTGVWLIRENRMATPAEADAILGDTPRDDASIRATWRAQHCPGSAA